MRIEASEVAFARPEHYRHYIHGYLVNEAVAWAGDFAWGDRYVSTAVQLVALLAIPLLLQHRRNAGWFVWTGGIVLLYASILIQIESLMFWLPLEIYQEETLGHPTWVLVLRAKNILAFALNKMQAWGLNNIAMTQDPWDYVHITTWNFLPFLLRRVGEAPAWTVGVAFSAWIAGLAALTAILIRIRALYVSGEWESKV